MLENEFWEYETALEEASPETTKRYRLLYEKSGGEQFWPDPLKIKCKFKFSTFI